MDSPKLRLLARARLHWKPITLHETFEKVIAGILSIAVAIFIIVSLMQLIRTIYAMLLTDAMNPLDHAVFQAVFGMIMTLLIAMEFQHSIIRMAVRGDSLIQVKTVLLIGLIAMARKFIILDPADTNPAKVAALSVATLALGVVYWLLRERDDRLKKLSSQKTSE